MSVTDNVKVTCTYLRPNEYTDSANENVVVRFSIPKHYGLEQWNSAKL